MPMPNRVKVFPRGYSGGQAHEVRTHTQRGGDADVTQLWKEYTSPENNSELWSFRRRGIELAYRMLAGRRGSWFVSQDTNPMVRSYNYQFVMDTIRYIATGRRKISIHAWPDLVTNHPVDGLDDVSSRHEIADLLRDLYSDTSPTALIQMWCARPGGFDDMVCTLNILFGDIPLKVSHD